MDSMIPLRTDTQLVPLAHFTNWLAFGERGISSEAIVSRLTGTRVGGFQHFSTHPCDPADFRRCQLLLEAHPLARLKFMRDVSPQWERLVDAWDEIHEAILAEVPGYLGRVSGAAPKAYRLMRRVIDDGITCESCDGTGRADACRKCKGTGSRSGGRCRAEGCYRGYAYCPTCRGAGFTRGDA
jgi:hypothetical protein